jgi:hypothetical protein
LTPYPKVRNRICNLDRNSSIALLRSDKADITFFMY